LFLTHRLGHHYVGAGPTAAAFPDAKLAAAGAKTVAQAADQLTRYTLATRRAWLAANSTKNPPCQPHLRR
jgi:hypothetical protein